MCQRRVGPQVMNFRQPHSVQLYNQYMGGVDHHDQHRSKYDVGRKGKKAWRYLFWFALNCSIVNAYILYKMAAQRTTKKKRFTHLDFRLELISELIGGFTKRKRSAQDARHQPLVETANLMGHVHCRLGDKRLVCKYHSKHMGIRKETVYGCDTCKVHLCQDGCHAKWHNL